MSTAILSLGGIPTERFPVALREWKVDPSAVVICTGQRADHPTTPWIREQATLAGLEEPWVQPRNQPPGNPPSLITPFILDNGAAWDTRTDFICSWPWVKQFGAHRVVIVTSPWHMPRAAAIAQACYFGRGIEIIQRPAGAADPARQANDAKFIANDRNVTAIWRATGILRYNAATRRARQACWDGRSNYFPR